MTRPGKITNTTQGTLLCSTHEVADSSWKKMKGLMLRESLPEGHGMLFPFSPPSPGGMWMLLMRFPIDMLFLDSRKRVVHIVENAPPIGLSWKTWRVYFSKKPASYVLELPAGSTAKSRTNIGDEIEF
jgi:uncharacterized protein